MAGVRCAGSANGGNGGGATAQRDEAVLVILWTETPSDRTGLCDPLRGWTRAAARSVVKHWWLSTVSSVLCAMVLRRGK